MFEVYLINFTCICLFHCIYIFVATKYTKLSNQRNEQKKHCIKNKQQKNKHVLNAKRIKKEQL